MLDASIPIWPLQKEVICRMIRRHRAPFRIILKTRNDPIFLADWHRHHAAIVGADNLIIADNMSDDAEVHTILQELSCHSTVFRFSGFHNDLHRRDLNSKLYEAIEETCDWSILIDTDERLIWVDSNNWIADDRIVAILQGTPAMAAAVPGLLIENEPGAKDRFIFPSKADLLKSVLHWGKPVIASRHGLPRTGPQCHNIQFPPEFFSASLPPQLVQLHLCNLFSEQRLRANREKLAARGVCERNTPYAAIARIDLNLDKRPAVRRLVGETRLLLKQGRKRGKGTLVMQSGGKLDFTTEEARISFDFVQTEGANILNQALASRS